MFQKRGMHQFRAEWLLKPVPLETPVAEPEEIADGGVRILRARGTACSSGTGPLRSAGDIVSRREARCHESVHRMLQCASLP
eukprot:2779439-Pyramimonas_sp.AAC.1